MIGDNMTKPKGRHLLRMQDRIRAAMSDGHPLIAKDIVARLYEQYTTAGTRYRTQPNTSALVAVMKQMDEIKLVENRNGPSLWILKGDDEE